MNGKTGGNRGARLAGACAVVAAVATLTTACGVVHVHFGSGSSSNPASAQTPTFAQELALAQCMRGHGVPSFPDPESSGGFSSSVLSTLDNTQVQAAYGACRHLLPGGGPTIGQLLQQAQQQQQAQARALPALVKFSQCMRGHGVPDYPDPQANDQIPSPAGGINPDSPQFRSAVSACQSVLPAGEHVSINAQGSYGAHG